MRAHTSAASAARAAASAAPVSEQPKGGVLLLSQFLDEANASVKQKELERSGFNNLCSMAAGAPTWLNMLKRRQHG